MKTEMDNSFIFLCNDVKKEASYARIVFLRLKDVPCEKFLCRKMHFGRGPAEKTKCKVWNTSRVLLKLSIWWQFWRSKPPNISWKESKDSVKKWVTIVSSLTFKNLQSIKIIIKFIWIFLPRYIANICQFWYTTAIFTHVKIHQKLRNSQNWPK